MIFFSPSFRCDFNFIIANIIYSIYLYFTSSIKKPNRIIHSKLPPPTPPYFYSLCYAPSFRNTSNPINSNPIYRNYLYLALSLISRTTLSARSNPPPKISHNFQVFAISLPSCRKNLKSSKFIIRIFLHQSAVTPDNITVYALSDVKTGSS